MKTTVLFEYPTMHGGERSLLAVIRVLSSDPNRQWKAIAPSDGPLAQCLHAIAVPLIALPRFSGAQRQRQTRQFLQTALRQHEPDLIHANSLSMARMVGPVAQSLNIPAIGHLRDIIRLSAKAIADLNTLRRLIAVSQATRDYHVGQGLLRDRVDVILNGVDLGEFHPAAATGFLHKQLQIPPAAPLIGGIGQLGIRKGWDVLFAALDRVFADHPLVHFLLVGEQSSQKPEADRFVASLQQRAEHFNLAGRVHFLGRRHDVAAFLRELTLLVHPARQEPLGRVLLEAGAVGVPIVATNVGGTLEIFPADSQAALLVRPDNPVDLATAILRILPDEASRQQMATRARCRIESAFAIDRCADATWCLYQQVAERNHRPS